MRHANSRPRRAACGLLLLLGAAAALLLAACAVPFAPAPSTYVGPMRAEPPPWWHPPDEGPLRLDLQEAALLALANNRAFRVDLFSPDIQRTAEDEQQSAFDPVARSSVSVSRERFKRIKEFFGGIEDIAQTQHSAEATITQIFPTGTGVRIEAKSTGVYAKGDATDEEEQRIRVGLTATQALLRGGSTEANLAVLRQARLDTRISEYQLRAAAEQLLADVESAYWDYALAVRAIAICEQSVRLAEQQLRETNERIRIGKLAEAERSAAEAELALRKEDLINARSNQEKARLKLLQFVAPDGNEFWDRDVQLLDEPEPALVELGPAADHVALALRMRSDLNQARLSVQRGDLDVVRTKDGLLPRLDFYVQVGRSGIDMFTFGGAADDIEEGNYDALAGLDFEYALGNRAARAQYRRAVLSRAQALEAVRNLEHITQVDVRSACIEANRTREQITATAATRWLREEVSRAEQAKLRVGKSTSLLVATAQRDLVQAQIAEIEAKVNYLKALIELYRLEGSLLVRRGIDAPGGAPAAE